MTSATSPSPANSPAVAIWLLFTCAMIFAMAVIGAITRLTESGLSIMEWAPISGALPPLSEAEWQRLFTLYQETDEFKVDNPNMDMAGFKTIFWWEWIHRQWGRLIGLVYALPLAWFWWRGHLDGRWKKLLLIGLALGALQGFMGWYMVASGFGARTDVSQYRLVMHLGLALIIYCYLLWLAFIWLGWRQASPHKGMRISLHLFSTLMVLVIVTGGFVAGLNAGYIYASFPTMGGDIVPADYRVVDNWWRNAFESLAAAQFHHRWLAKALVVAALLLFFFGMKLELTRGQAGALTALALMSLVQAGIGIATLLLLMPIWLAALHQAGAITILTILVFTKAQFRRP